MQLAALSLWLKALHIAFMVTWFAGLFYLPRLFIYHAEAPDEAGRRRFTVMEKRLYVIMTIGAVITAVFGVLLLAINPQLLSQNWFQLKLLVLAGMVVYHLRCRQWITKLQSTMATQESRGLRWFNEIPAVFLLAIVFLAVLKPF